MSRHFRVLKDGGWGRQILKGNDGMAAEERRSWCPRYLHMNNETHTKLHLHYRHMWNASFKPPSACLPPQRGFSQYFRAPPTIKRRQGDGQSAADVDPAGRMPGHLRVGVVVWVVGAGEGWLALRHSSHMLAQTKAKTKCDLLPALPPQRFAVWIQCVFKIGDFSKNRKFTENRWV